MLQKRISFLIQFLLSHASLLGLMILGAMPHGHGAAVGALIDESLVEVELFVKQIPEASDANDGTNDRPFRTIQAAVNRALILAQNGQGVKVHVFPGTYRESVVMKQELGVFNACIVIESWDAGEAILSGTDVLNRWQVEDEMAFERRWPYRLSKKTTSKYPWLMTRGELLFVEDSRLKQVRSLDRVRKGTFYIDESKKQIFLLPPRGGQIMKGSVEVGNPARQTLFYAENIQDLIIRDMAFVRAPTSLDHPHEAVSFVDCNQLILENCLIQYNSRSGLSLDACSNVLLRFLFADHNGWTGFRVRDCINLLIQGGEAEVNGWRLLEAKFAKPDTFAAVELELVEELSIRGLRVAENRSSGLRLSNIDEKAGLSKLFVAGNTGYGVELLEGDFELKSSNILRNQNTGIYTTADLFLKGNVIFDNLGFQIKAARLQAKNNIVGAHKAGNQILSLVEGSSDSLMFEKNLYHSIEPEPFLYAGESVNFEDWQVLTGQDLTSIQADPQFVDYKGYDYLPLPESPWYSLGKRKPRVISAEQTKAARADLEK